MPEYFAVFTQGTLRTKDQMTVVLDSSHCTRAKTGVAIVSPDGNLAVCDNEARQCGVLGNLCFVYGVFILLLILIPNRPAGRLIIFCGGVITAVGLLLRYIAARSWQKVLLAKS